MKERVGLGLQLLQAGRCKTIRRLLPHPTLLFCTLQHGCSASTGTIHTQSAQPVMMGGLLGGLKCPVLLQTAIVVDSQDTSWDPTMVISTEETEVVMVVRGTQSTEARTVG